MASDVPQSENGSEASSPPNNYGQGPKRETLSSRAKRVIGRAIDPPDKKNALPGRKGPPKKTPNKRREQVLKAQRTHRQRTQGYIRELEKEVLRLRDSESALRKQNADLQQKNRELEERLARSSVATPSTSPSDQLQYQFSDLQLQPSFLSSSGDVVSITSESSHGSILVASDSETMGSISPLGYGHDTTNVPSVNVDFTKMAGVELVHVCNLEPETLVPPEFEPPTTTAQLPQKIEAATPADFPELNSQQALDFVLGLESICFPHIAYDQINPTHCLNVPDANRGPHHVYSATTNLIHHRLPKDPRTEVFQYPKPDLHKMFQSSLHVDFGTDVTPVQVWANLARLNNLGYVLDRDFVSRFMDELKRYVRCNGYGAVIDKEIISSLFGTFFPGQNYVVTWSTPSDVIHGVEN